MVRKSTIGRLIIYSNRTDTSYNCRDVPGMLTAFSEGLVHSSQLHPKICGRITAVRWSFVLLLDMLALRGSF